MNRIWLIGHKAGAACIPAPKPQTNLKLPEKLAELGKPDRQNNASVQEAMKTGSATGLRDRELAGLRNDSNTTQLGQLVHKQLDVLDQASAGKALPGLDKPWIGASNETS